MVLGRRRLTLIGGLLLGSLSTCVGSGRERGVPALGPGTSTAVAARMPTLAPQTAAPTAATATTVSVAAPMCRPSQIVVFLAGIQGLSGGTFTAAYWIYNPSPSACALPRALSVRLLDGKGVVLMRLASQAAGAVILPARISRPAQYNPTPGTIAYFGLDFTPIDEAAAGIPCPVPTLVPASLRLRFGSMEPIRTTSVMANSRTVEVCKGAAGLFPVSLIT